MGTTTPVGTIQNKFRDDFAATSLVGRRWRVVQQGAGMTVDLATPSAMRILAGATPNSETILRSVEAYEIPCRVMFLPLLASLVNQRVANQEIELRLTNEAGTSYVSWLLRGTSATTYTVRHANGGVAGADADLTSLPDTNTGSPVLEIETWIDEIYWHIRTADNTASRTGSWVRNRRIPDPDERLFVEIRVRNLATAPTTGTILALDAITVQDVTELTAEITAGRGGGADSQAIRVTGAVSIPSGNVTSYNVATAADPVSSTNLTANAAFTQTGVDTGSNTPARPTRHRPTVMHLAGQTHGTLRLEESTDGTNWRETWRQPIPSDGQYHTFDVPQHLRYFRWIFQNGSVAQTAFYLADVTIRGEGPADVDKVLTFPFTAAAGGALAAAGTIVNALDLGGNHQWDVTRAYVKSDQAGTIYIDESQDGTNWFTIGSGAAVAANTAARMEIPISLRYLRFRVVNGATAATALFAAAVLVSN